MCDFAFPALPDFVAFVYRPRKGSVTGPLQTSLNDRFREPSGPIVRLGEVYVGEAGRPLTAPPIDRAAKGSPVFRRWQLRALRCCARKSADPLRSQLFAGATFEGEPGEVVAPGIENDGSAICYILAVARNQIEVGFD